MCAQYFFWMVSLFCSPEPYYILAAHQELEAVNLAKFSNLCQSLNILNAHENCSRWSQTHQPALMANSIILIYQLLARANACAPERWNQLKYTQDQTIYNDDCVGTFLLL